MKIDIVYQDKYLIVVNKPYNLLTIATDKEKDRTLYHQILTYEKQKHKANKIFVVHRLDRETSGLIIFAKNEKVKRLLQEKWDDLVVTRGYMAIVEGQVTNDNDVIKSYLKENKNFISYSTNEKDGRLAITEYKKIKTNKHYSLLQIKIKTGRKNQIRVHMKDINHPIIGDKKYGSKKNPIKRLGLHANILEFNHPITKQLLKFDLSIPKEFLNLGWNKVD